MGDVESDFSKLSLEMSGKFDKKPKKSCQLCCSNYMLSDARVVSIMEGLRSPNEIRQVEAAGELAEWLLMANEDSLPSHLPIREIVQSLIQLLQMEHNFELVWRRSKRMTNSFRC